MQMQQLFGCNFHDKFSGMKTRFLFIYLLAIFLVHLVSPETNIDVNNLDGSFLRQRNTFFFFFLEIIKRKKDLILGMNVQALPFSDVFLP